MHAAHVKEDQQFGKYAPYFSCHRKVLKKKLLNIPKLERNCLKKKGPKIKIKKKS